MFIHFSSNLGEGLIMGSCHVAKHNGSVFRHSGSSSDLSVLWLPY